MLYATIINNSNCACLDGQVVPLIYDPTQSQYPGSWTGIMNVPASCGGVAPCTKPLNFVCLGGIADYRLILGDGCSVGASTPLAPNAGSQCNPLNYRWTIEPFTFCNTPTTPPRTRWS